MLWNYEDHYVCSSQPSLEGTSKKPRLDLNNDPYIIFNRVGANRVYFESSVLFNFTQTASYQKTHKIKQVARHPTVSKLTRTKHGLWSILGILR